MAIMTKPRRREAKTRLRFRASRDLPLYLLLLPALALLITFRYIPIYGIIIAFKRFSPYRGIMNSPWVGLDHFRYFLRDSNFWRVMGSTVWINVLNLLWATPVPVLFALMLNEVRQSFAKRFVQTVSYLPHFISWVIAASIVSSILSPTTGIVNIVLQKVFGIAPIYFLIKPAYFRTILVVSGIWKGFGMGAVYYLAALSGIDPQLYEASAIDGAGKLRQTFHITIPGILPIFTLLLILNIGSMISIGFEQIFLLYNSIVYDVGDVISTYTYRLGIEKAEYSLTTAIGLSQSVVNFILVYGANRLSKKLTGLAMW